MNENFGRSVGNPRSSVSAITLDASFLSALWVSCLGLGVAGQVLHYPEPPAARPAPPAITAQSIEVQLTQDPQPPEPVAAPNPTRLPIPAEPEAVSAPSIPEALAVAEPTPTIAFALPVEGPVRVVPAKEAAYAAPQTVASNTPLVVASAPAPAQRLTFGVGEGKQPAPEYPRAALQAGQRGTVGVRFVVGENGRVISAEASEPCPHALLNSAAVGTVRRRWRFQPGPVRAYEVPIRFELER